MKMHVFAPDVPEILVPRYNLGKGAFALAYIEGENLNLLEDMVMTMCCAAQILYDAHPHCTSRVIIPRFGVTHLDTKMIRGFHDLTKNLVPPDRFAISQCYFRDYIALDAPEPLWLVVNPLRFTANEQQFVEWSSKIVKSRNIAVVACLCASPRTIETVRKLFLGGNHATQTRKTYN